MQNLRQTLIAKIHIAKKELGLDDDVYRELLVRVSGERSCKGLNNTQLQQVLDELKRQGFKAKKSDKPRVAKACEPLLGKLEALLADNNLPWAYAHGMAKKMFNRHRVQWLNASELHRLVAALQIYANRKKK